MEPTVALHIAEPDLPVDDLQSALAGRDYGPITHLLNDDTISEVMVNGPNQVYIERKGQLTPVDVKFESDAELIRVIRDRKSTRLNSSHVEISYAVFCLKKKKKT